MTQDIKEAKEYKDLIKSLSEKREELRAFRFGIAGSKVKKVTDAKNLKKEIARILTKLQNIEHGRK